MVTWGEFHVDLSGHARQPSFPQFHRSMTCEIRTIGRVWKKIIRAWTDRSGSSIWIRNPEAWIPTVDRKWSRRSWTGWIGATRRRRRKFGKSWRTWLRTRKSRATGRTLRCVCHLILFVNHKGFAKFIPELVKFAPKSFASLFGRILFPLYSMANE